MDREMIERHLELARRHVAEAERHVAEQQERVLRMERGGHDTTQAARLLDDFEDLQRIYIADCDRLESELERHTQK